MNIMSLATDAIESAATRRFRELPFERNARKRRSLLSFGRWQKIRLAIVSSARIAIVFSRSQDAPDTMI